MKRITYIMMAMACLILTATTSCDDIHDDLPACQQGATNINIYVERFLGDMNPPFFTRVVSTTSETCPFADRIKTLNYYLYRDGVIYEKGIINATEIMTPTYLFQRENLPYGNYHLVLAANCSERVFRGTTQTPSDLNILYQSGDDAADFFVDTFDFSVNDDQTHDYVTQLKRMHGMVRFTFTNYDPRIRTVEITMDGLTSSGCVTGTYSDDYTYVAQIPLGLNTVVRAEGSLINEPSVVGLFPTLENGVSSWSVRIFGDDPDAELASKQISNNIRVVRNDLLDLSAQFESDGRVQFFVNKELVWDGTIEAGGILE